MTKERLKEIIDEIIKRKTIDSEGHWKIDLTLGSGGYPSIGRDGKFYRVSRLIVAYYHGLDLDDKKQLALHKNECNDKACISPEHLYLGNDSKNRYDAIEMGYKPWDNGNYNLNKTNCGTCNSPYDKKNTIWERRGTKRSCRNCKRRLGREHYKRKKLKKEIIRIDKINQNKIDSKCPIS